LRLIGLQGSTSWICGLVILALSIQIKFKYNQKENKSSKKKMNKLSMTGIIQSLRTNSAMSIITGAVTLTT
jgi:hypothetical protein